MTLLDTRYTAETPEGIALALRPAGVVPRGYAFLIDLLIRGVVVSALALLFGRIGRFGTAFTLIAWFLIEWFYPVLFELTLSGATPGKRSIGLKVVMDSGLPVTPAASITRNLLRAADFLPFLYAGGAFSMLARPDFKRIGDLAAGTLVVYSTQATLHAALPPAPPSAPEFELTPRAQAAVVAWAGRIPRLTEARVDELAALATKALPRGARRLEPTAGLLGVAHWLLGERR